MFTLLLEQFAHMKYNLTIEFLLSAGVHVFYAVDPPRVNSKEWY